MPTENSIERARMALEDAVLQALEVGMSKADIEAEVQYALENADDV